MSLKGTPDDKSKKNIKLDKNSDLHASRNKSKMDFAGGSTKK